MRLFSASLATCSAVYHVARLAQPVFSSEELCVFRCVFVSTWAVCLSSLMFSRISAQSIFSWRYWLKMFWVNATRNAAQVVKVKPLWNWTNENLIGYAVGAAHSFSTSPRTYLSVSEMCCSSPKPATRIWLWGNHRQQSFDKTTLMSRHRDPFQSRCLGLRSVEALLRPVFYCSAEVSA